MCSSSLERCFSWTDCGALATMLTAFLPFFWRVLGSAVLVRNAKWQLEREVGGSVLSRSDATWHGCLSPRLCREGEKADLAGYQFWHRICV